MHHSPPTLTKSWFHPGPVAAAEAGDWTELDLSHEYWPGDPPQLTRTAELDSACRAARPAADALRALRGQVLRTELYALDGTDRADRPYTVTESVSEVRRAARAGLVPLRHRRSGRTQWERGNDPMTQFTFTDRYDEFGLPTRQLAVAVPRGPRPAGAGSRGASRTWRRTRPRGTPAATICTWSTGSPGPRPAKWSTTARSSVFELRDAVLAGDAELRVIGHSRTFYDGPAFVGLPLGQLGEHGLPVRTESLAFTDAFLDDAVPGRHAALPRPGAPRPGPTSTRPNSGSWSRRRIRPLPRRRGPGLAGRLLRRRTRGSPTTCTTRHGCRAGCRSRSRDPLGAESHVDYDEHDLLPIRTTDPAGLVIESVHDLRVLQPAEVTDVNGNTSSVGFSPAGFRHRAASSAARTARATGPSPSVVMVYDLLAFDRGGQPASVRSERRVQHDTVRPGRAR